jgi:hypothetical protein
MRLEKLPDANAFAHWLMRDLRGLALFGVALAVSVFLLGISLLILFGIEPPLSQNEARGPLYKIFMVTLVGPFLETMLIAAVLSLFLRFEPLWVASVLGIALGVLHGIINGVPGYFTFYALTAFVLVLHIGWIENGFWIGIKRSFTLHATYNFVVVIVSLIFPV